LESESGGRLALTCLAAAHDRVPLDEPHFARAIERLAEEGLHDTYGLSLRLMVAAELEAFPDRRSVAARDLARLLRHQARDGIFGYGPQPGHGDLSNSQYAALGLRAALWLGLEVPRQVWDRLASGTLSHQQSDGGFGYVRRSAATLSMTTAGIAILELCRERLAAERVATGRLERSIAGGWR